MIFQRFHSEFPYKRGKLDFFSCQCTATKYHVVLKHSEGPLSYASQLHSCHLHSASELQGEHVSSLQRKERIRYRCKDGDTVAVTAKMGTQKR